MDFLKKLSVVTFPFVSVVQNWNDAATAIPRSLELFPNVFRFQSPLAKKTNENVALAYDLFESFLPKITKRDFSVSEHINVKVCAIKSFFKK